MCVGAVESVKRVVIPRKFFNKAIKTKSLVRSYWVCVLVSCGRTDWVGFVVPQ